MAELDTHHSWTFWKKSAVLWVKSLDGELKALQNLCRTPDVSSVAQKVTHAWHLLPCHETGRKRSEKDIDEEGEKGCKTRRSE